MKDGWGPQPIGGEVDKQLEQIRLNEELARLERIPDPELNIEPKTTTVSYPPGQETTIPMISNMPLRFEALLDFRKGLPAVDEFTKIYYEQFRESPFLVKAWDGLAEEFPTLNKRITSFSEARKRARMVESQNRERGGWRANPTPSTTPEELAEARYLFARSLRYLAQVARQIDPNADPTDFVR